MTGGGFSVLDTGPSINDAHRFSGVSYIRGPSWLHMPTLTIGLLGISIVWSVEMAYASPYLLSLGLSKSAMAIVFVAGPLSGLVMQPVIGVLADSNTSRWGRRRPYMIVGTLICVFAMSLLGWTKEVAGIFTQQIALTLWLAVISVYLIDFSVNAVMAVDRALLVDILPSTLQPSGNAWAARMGGLGSVVGYFAGNLDLPSLLPIFGHTELQILSVIVSFILFGSHIVMASSVSERVLLKSDSSGAGGPLAKSFTTQVRAMFENMWLLPRVIRQIFLIQFFAWISWFPIMFYSTLYIGDLYKRSFFASAILVPPPEISEDSLIALDTEATRIGSRALFYSSLLALFMNVVLPFFTTEASSSSRRRKQERQQHSAGFGGPASARLGGDEGPWWRRLAIPEFVKVRLVSLWAISQGVLACCMLATFFTSSVAGGTLLITITGFSWAITQWAPFALLGEAILTEPSSGFGADEPSFGGGIRLVDTRSSRLSTETGRGRGRSSESRRGQTSLDERRRQGRVEDDDATETETIFVAGHIDEDGEDRRKLQKNDGDAENDDSTGAMQQKGNVIPSYREDEEDVLDEGAVLVGRTSRDEEEGIRGSGSGLLDETEDEDGEGEGEGGGLSAKAGIILGIHNIFVVMPQLIVTGLSSVIFALVDPAKSVLHGSHPGGTLGLAHNHTTTTTAALINGRDITGSVVSFFGRDDTDIGDELEMIQDLQASATSNSVVYIFRIGGVSALIAFILCWRLARELRHR
ncbi:sucrose transporter [Lentinula raphanica]|nr:sucrose transporter [Lentinula raphanica]